MIEDKRLAAALRWCDRGRDPEMSIEEECRSYLAAIDAEDPMRKPVTEEEARAVIRVWFLEPPDSDWDANAARIARMTNALTAFLAGRGVAARTEPEPARVVTDEMVERACEAGWNGWGVMGAVPRAERRLFVRRLFEAALGTPAPVADTAADLRALAVRMLAVEERVCDNESIRERLTALETGLASEVNKRLAALEARPAWTAEMRDLLRDVGYAAHFDTPVHKSALAAFPPDAAPRGPRRRRTMPDELKPPPEYAHLRWHWLKPRDDQPEPWSWHNEDGVEYWQKDNCRILPSQMAEYGTRYIAPAVPITADDATVERMCVARSHSLNIKDWDGVPELVKNIVRDEMRAVLAELMKGS